MEEGSGKIHAGLVSVYSPVQKITGLLWEIYPISLKVYILKFWQKIIRALIRILIVFNYFTVKLIPFKAAVFIGGCLGRIVWLVFGRERAGCVENLRKSFPEKSENEIAGISKEVFMNQGKNYMELLCFPRLKKNRLNKYVKIQNEEIIRKALDGNNGVIILTAHFGNWELLGAALGTNGYPLWVIARRIYDNILNKWLINLRLTRNIHIIQRGESPKEILSVFKRNRMLGVILDQYSSRVPGVFVDFFGRQCYTSNGLASIVAKKDIPVIPCFIVRQKQGHLLCVGEPVEPIRLDDREAEIRENTQNYTKVIESWIRKHPSQWVWMHDRWKAPKIA